MSMDFTDQRLSYEKGALDQQSVPASPFELFKVWMDEAIAQKVQEPYAMSLATCGADNKPSVRIVLLREITDTGIIFYVVRLRRVMIFIPIMTARKDRTLQQTPMLKRCFFGMSWSAKFVLVVVLLKLTLKNLLPIFKNVHMIAK